MAGGPERCWAAWLPAGVRRGGPVLCLVGCRMSVWVAGFLGAGLDVGVVPGRVWVDLAASTGADGFRVTRRRARYPRPRLPITTAAAW